MSTFDTITKLTSDLDQAYQYTPLVQDTEVVIIVDTIGEQVDWDMVVAGIFEQSVQSWALYILVEDMEDVPANIRTLLTDDNRVHISVIVPEQQIARRVQIAAECTSPFICIIDPQVRVAPTFIEKCIWVIATNTSISFCSGQSSDAFSKIWLYGFEQGIKFLDENFVGHTFVITRAAFLSNDSYAEALPRELVEWEFWLRQAADGRWGFSIAEVLLYRNAPTLGTGRTQATERARVHIRERYAIVLRNNFPQALQAELQPYETISHIPVLVNRLARSAKKRLLIIMPWLIVGGAERVNLDVTRYLCAAGYEISFATTYTPANHGWAEEFGRYTPDIFILDRFLRLPDYPRFLIYLIQSRQIDVVLISNSYFGYQLLPYLRAYCPDVTFVDYLHSQEEGWKNGGYPRCGVAYQELLDLNITSSEYVKNWMVERGADAERIEVAYTNVDTEKWQPNSERRRQVRERLGIDEQTSVILFIGRLSPEKRPKLLAQIIQRLDQRSPGRFRCFVLGAGPESAMLDLQVRLLKISHVFQPLGRVDDSTLYDYMAAGDILLLPSQVEGISVAVFEAMAMGMVPVSAWVGGQPELVTKECGILIHHSPDELDSYVDHLQSLVTNYDLRRRMGAAARYRVERLFPLSALGPRIAELLERADQYRRLQPRLAVGLGLSREYATQAIEYTRIERALDSLWVEREGWKAHPAALPGVAPPSITRQQFLRGRLKARLYPIYKWGIDRDMIWLVTLKNVLNTYFK